MASWREAMNVFRRGRPELLTLLLLGVIAAGIWIFVEVADEVLEGQTRSVDESILLWFRSASDPSNPIGPRWFEDLVRDITSLGSAGVLLLLTAISIVYLLLDGKRRLALLAFVAVIGGFLMSVALKHYFMRPRPELVPHGAYVTTSSFPSGHSMMSAVVFLTLGALLARAQPKPRLKAFIMVVAVLFTILVGVSRVYLGVHWPTDVLAGWAAGAAWASLCWIVARVLQVEGKVEREDQG